MIILFRQLAALLNEVLTVSQIKNRTGLLKTVPNTCDPLPLCFGAGDPEVSAHIQLFFFLTETYLNYWQLTQMSAVSRVETFSNSPCSDSLKSFLNTNYSVPIRLTRMIIHIHFIINHVSKYFHLESLEYEARLFTDDEGAR